MVADGGVVVEIFLFVCSRIAEKRIKENALFWISEDVPVDMYAFCMHLQGEVMLQVIECIAYAYKYHLNQSFLI